MVNINDVIQILTDERILKGDKILLGTTPHHGSCCTCQKCGQVYDECICDHNRILEKLLNLENING